jgi:hypothetical protein
VSTVATVSPTVTQILDVTQGMALLTDTPTYQSYLRRFVHDYSEAAVVIQTSLEQGMRASAAALAHKLSGVAANLAMTHTRQAAQALEQVLVTDTDPSLALAHLKDSLAAVVAEINRVALPVNKAHDAPNAVVGANLFAPPHSTGSDEYIRPGKAGVSPALPGLFHVNQR